MDDLQGTLGYSGWRGSKNLGELVSGEYWAFGVLIWCWELISLALLLLMGSEIILFLELGAWGSICIVHVCGDHSQLSFIWLCKTTDTWVTWWHCWPCYVSSVTVSCVQFDYQ